MKTSYRFTHILKLVLFSMFILQVSLFGGSESEYNSGKYNANSVSENSTTTGSIKSGDDDYFKFTASSNSDVNIKTTGFSKKMTILLMKGCAWDSVDLQTVSASSNGEDVTLTHATESGVEYCVALSSDSNANKSYTLTIGTLALTANDKSFSTNSGTPLSKNVINDGGTADSDIDGGTLTISENTAPSNGSLSISENGDFTYTPNDSYIGSDSFTYTISNGTSTATATATIQMFSDEDEEIPTAESNATEAICGSFEDVLQTRDNDTRIVHSGGASAIVYDSPDCTLNTGDVDFGWWQELTCEGGIDGEATATGSYGTALNPIYDGHTPAVASISSSPSSSTTDVTVTSSQTLSEIAYNNIDIGSGGIGSLDVTLSNVRQINSLDFTTNNSVTFSTSTPYNLEIGSIGTVNNGSGNSLTTSTIPKNIKINTLELPASATIDFEATQTIKMETFTIGRAGTEVTLKAPYVNINNLTQSNSYGGTSHITIIADYVDIGALTLDQEATIEFQPYTAGQRVLFQANSISASSSSSMIVDSGNYYTNSFAIPGTSDVSSIAASDDSQLINFYINGDFSPGNNPGINSAGNDGNYGDLPAENFILFINGDLNTGGGGTTFNATVYVEGSATFGSPSYVKGAISSGGDITIGNSSEFYFDQGISDAGWGDCSDTGAPVFQNEYACGIFDNVLTSYTSITSQGSHDEAFYTDSIAYPKNGLTGDFTCNHNNASEECLRDDPPANQLEYTVYVSSKLGTSEDTPSGELTEVEYGDFDGDYDLTLNPSQTYQDDTTKVMLLGDITLTGANTLSLAPGDYYINSLTFSKNNPEIVLSGTGSVRIFIKNDFVVTKNGLNINENGTTKDLFVYVAGDMDFQTDGNVETMNGFFYVEGSAKFNANSNNFDVHGAITAEGAIDVSGQNGDFYQDSNASDLGYGECQLCYAYNTGGSFIGLAKLLQIGFSFPRTIGIINDSGETLQDVSVTQTEDTSGLSGTGGCYNLVDQDGHSLDDDIEIEVDLGASISAFGHDCAVGLGVTTVEVDYGDYASGGYDEYNAIKTLNMGVTVFGEQNLYYTADYKDADGKHYASNLEYCDIISTTISTYLSGPFDAWDVTTSDETTPPITTDRNITTKIVNRAFPISLASLNKTNDAYELKYGSGSTIDVAVYTKETNVRVSEPITFDANATAHIEDTGELEPPQTFTVDRAVKDAVVGFKLCATYEHNETVDDKIYYLHDTSECIYSDDSTLYDCNATTTGSPTWHICYSSDNFAVRPYAFRVFGGDSYSRAGEEFNVGIRAVDESNNSIDSGNSDSVSGTRDYNATFSDLTISSNFYSPTHDELLIMYNNVEGGSASDNVMKARVATCSESGVFTKVNSSDSFIDGNLTGTLKFSETGILTLDVNETIGHEFAIVDNDDTPVADRLILGSSSIKSKNDISIDSLLLVNPYSLNTEADYNTSNSKDWVYMNDISDAAINFVKPDMSAYLHYTVTAKNKDGNVTKNFTSTCFPDVTEHTPALPTDCPRVNGLKLNTTYDFKLTANMNSTADVNLSIYNGDKDDNALYIDLLDQDAHLSIGDNSVEKATMYPKQFTNGVAESNVHFNVDREITNAKNPVKIKVIDVNTSLGWVSSASPAEFNGATLNKSYNYIYGRTHGPRQKFSDDATPVEHDALIYYEAYCYDPGCDTTLLPGTPTHNDDPRWWINTEHTAASGKATAPINEKSNSGTITIGTPLPSGANPDTVKVKYDGTKGYPYVTTMENNASSWLIYNKYNANADSNEFTLEFYRVGGDYVGSGESSKDINMSDSATGNNLNEHKSWW